MDRLTIPRIQLEDILRRLLGRGQEAAVCSVGRAQWGPTVDWLARPARWAPFPWVARTLAEGNAAVFLVSDRPAGELRHWWLQCAEAQRTGSWMFVAVGSGQAQGQVGAMVLSPTRGSEGLDQLRLVGAGMHSVPLQNAAQMGSGSLPDPLDRPPDSQPAPLLERWSRTIGALGEGVYRRLTGLHYGIVGCGRTGSLIATGLAKLGVGRVTLVDPDRVEVGNLGEMDGVRGADVGRPKAVALGETLRGLDAIPPVEPIESVVSSVTTLRALLALKPCDVLINCTDNDGARLAAGILAALYHKIFLDLGTGVFDQNGPGPPPIRNPQSAIRNRRRGADVRLILPADGCLLCLGGLANEAQAQQILSSAGAEQAFHATRDWRTVRAGSLRSLNQLAAALGLRLLEDLVGEQVRQSTWLQVEYGEDGLPQLRALHQRRTTGCRLCAQAGAGDDGLAHVREMVITFSGRMSDGPRGSSPYTSCIGHG